MSHYNLTHEIAVIIIL